jgi:hypothetical protein
LFTTETRSIGRSQNTSIKIGDEPKTEAVLIAAALADKKDEDFFLADANTSLQGKPLYECYLQLLPPGLDFVLESP